MNPLTIAGLRARYASREKPEAVLAEVRSRIEARGSDSVWLALVTPEGIEAQLRALARRRDEDEGLPLYGIPFAIKDNIDAAGLPTTAACPAYAYQPAENATAVVDAVHLSPEITPEFAVAVPKVIAGVGTQARSAAKASA